LVELEGIAAQEARNSAPAEAAAQEPNLAELRTLIDKGHASAALKQLDELAARKPEPAGVERLRGIAFYVQSQFAESDRAFATALEQDGKDAEAAARRGVLLYRLGKPAEAIPLLEGLQQPVPGLEADPHYVLALCYISMRRYDDARRAIAGLYGFDPESAAAYQMAGRLLLRRGALAPAGEFAEKAVNLDARQPLAHMLLGEIELALQQPKGAIAEFEKERALNPLCSEIDERLGDAYLQAGDTEKAEKALQRSVLLEPNSVAPFLLLGKVLLVRGKVADAAAYLEHAAGMNAGNAITHTLLSETYRTLGRMEDAEREAAEAEKVRSGTKPEQETQ
jgi:tetratricopeptide (TPR) repeat protein